MGSGVAGQCSRIRFLVRWTVWYPVVVGEAEQVERTQRKTWRMKSPVGPVMGQSSRDRPEVTPKAAVAADEGR